MILLGVSQAGRSRSWSNPAWPQSEFWSGNGCAIIMFPTTHSCRWRSWKTFGFGYGWSLSQQTSGIKPALAKRSVGRAVKSVTHCVCSAERGTAPMYLSKFGVSRDARKKNGTQLVGELLLDGMQELSPNIRYPKCQWFQGVLVIFLFSKFGLCPPCDCAQDSDDPRSDRNDPQCIPGIPGIPWRQDPFSMIP